MLILSNIYRKHNEANRGFFSKNTLTKALNSKDYKCLGGEKYGLIFFLQNLLMLWELNADIHMYFIDQIHYFLNF